MNSIPAGHATMKSEDNEVPSTSRCIPIVPSTSRCIPVVPSTLRGIPVVPSTSRGIPMKLEAEAIELEPIQHLPVSSSPAFFAFSKNCKNFNRLFHSSFDDDSSSSSNNQQDQDVKCDKKLKVEQSNKVDILLELDIDTDQREESFSSSSIINLFRVKTEPNATANDNLEEVTVQRGTRSIIKEAAPKSGSNNKKKAQIGQRKSNRLPQTSTSCKTQEAQIMRQVSWNL